MFYPTFVSLFVCLSVGNACKNLVIRPSCEFYENVSLDKEAAIKF